LYAAKESCTSLTKRTPALSSARARLISGKEDC
jgi:hypothetical protein